MERDRGSGGRGGGRGGTTRGASARTRGASSRGGMTRGTRAQRSRLVFKTSRDGGAVPSTAAAASATAASATASAASASAASEPGAPAPAPPDGGAAAEFRRFDVQQWLRARERRLEESQAAQHRATSPPRSGRTAAPSQSPGYRRAQVAADSTDALATSLNAIGAKLHTISSRLGVGDAPAKGGGGGGGRAKQPPPHQSTSAAVRDRDELIVALHEVVKTQGQQLLVKEEEIREIAGALADYRDEEETMFALADAVEQLEHELTAEKENSEASGEQAASSQAEAKVYRERAASLEWQLRIAVPDKPMRQLIATQSEQARADDDDMFGRPPLDSDAAAAAAASGAGMGPERAEVSLKAAATESEQRRLFLTAARELARLHAEIDDVRAQEDACGLWGQRVDAIWSSVQTLSSEVELRKREVERQRHAQRQRENLLRAEVTRSEGFVSVSSPRPQATTAVADRRSSLFTSIMLESRMEPLLAAAAGAATSTEPTAVSDPGHAAQPGLTARMRDRMPTTEDDDDCDSDVETGHQVSNKRPTDMMQMLRLRRSGLTGDQLSTMPPPVPTRQTATGVPGDPHLPSQPELAALVQSVEVSLAAAHEARAVLARGGGSAEHSGQR